MPAAAAASGMLGATCALSLGLALGASAASALTTREARIAASADDAEESGTTGALDSEDDALELVRSGGASGWVGLRFPGLALPAGAVIRAAGCSSRRTSPELLPLLALLAAGAAGVHASRGTSKRSR